ncbi:MAG: hypothetical protein Q8L88_13865 [Bacteroidota bacterium]|nr:hypothetical protein [Bacteroidota bacterium]
MVSLNIFANFFIDTQERFLRVQDSFRSFKDISADKWIINIRGRYAQETMAILRDQIGDKLNAHKRQSNEGWFYDTRQMLSDINGDYVFFWLEDHINLARIELLENTIAEMKEHDIDYMLYTFWQNGQLRERYRGVELLSGNKIEYFTHTAENNRIIQKNFGGSYLISAASIVKTSLFHKIILADDPIQKRWPKETPYDFEKAPTDVHWLPMNVGIPKQELFASIDDDHDVKGSCLQSRGLYPIREGRTTYTQGYLQKIDKIVKNIIGKFKRRI